jgi:Family of unknown function (DUF6498)
MTDRASTLVLIAANLIPLLGVVLLDWDILAILLMYWAESVVVGIINVLRMIVCDNDNVLGSILPQLAGRPLPPELSQSLPKVSANAFKYFLIPFFIIHYGMFCYGHLTAVVGIFSDDGLSRGPGSALATLWQRSFWIGVTAIFVSHLYSFFTNYIGRGEYKKASLMLLMHRPYGRIVAMHLAIVFGAGLVMWLGSPLPMLLVLIAAKTALDMRLHEKERQKLGIATGDSGQLTFPLTTS